MSIDFAIILNRGRRDVGGAPEGADVLFASKLAGEGQDVIMVLRDDVGLARRAAIASFFAPDCDIIELPA